MKMLLMLIFVLAGMSASAENSVTDLNAKANELIAKKTATVDESKVVCAIALAKLIGLKEGNFETAVPGCEYKNGLATDDVNDLDKAFRNASNARAQTNYSNYLELTKALEVPQYADQKELLLDASNLLNDVQPEYCAQFFTAPEMNGKGPEFCANW